MSFRLLCLALDGWEAPWDEDLADGPTTEGELIRCLNGVGALAFAVGLARAPVYICASVLELDFVHSTSTVYKEPSLSLYMRSAGKLTQTRRLDNYRLKESPIKYLNQPQSDLAHFFPCS